MPNEFLVNDTIFASISLGSVSTPSHIRPPEAALIYRALETVLKIA
jgi:hypothetical protein